MALSRPRYSGKRVVINIDGSLTIWDEVTFTETENDEDATASDSELDEVVGTTKRLEGRASGYLGTVNNGATLPRVGDAIATMDVSDGEATPTSLIPDYESTYTNVKVRTVEYGFRRGPANWNFTFRSGVLD